MGIDITEKIIKITFGSLKVGDCFKFGNMFYMKVSYLILNDNIDENYDNCMIIDGCLIGALNLKTGSIIDDIEESDNVFFINLEVKEL